MPDLVLGMTPFRGILQGKDDHGLLRAPEGELPGMEQDGLSADPGELMLDFEVLKAAVLGKDVLEQRPQARDVPLAASQLVDQTTFRFLASPAEQREELLVRPANPEA